jgi:hypothetical protein
MWALFGIPVFFTAPIVIIIARRACCFWFALYLRGKPKEKINSAFSAIRAKRALMYLYNIVKE